MRRLAMITHQEKIDALCNAIRSKCCYPVSSRHISCIIENININRVYCIKTTRNSGKFLNFITEEFIATPIRKTISCTIPLYGKFTCGHFFKDERSSDSHSGTIDIKHDAAAIKRTITQHENELVSVTYTIVLYESGRFTS